MTTQAIPKLLFVNEDTEQLIDKRFGRQQIIEQNANKEIIKRWQYKFNSQVDLMPEYQIDQDDSGTSIFNTVYSTKLGMMIYNSKNGVVAYGIKEMEGIIKNANKINPTKLTEERGSLFLSPKQTKLLIVNQKFIFVYSLLKRFILNKKIENVHKLTNACWQNENEVYMWSFQGNLYNLSTSSGQFSQIQNVEKCTGVNRLGETRIIVLEGIKVYIYQQKVRAKSIEIAQLNQDTVLFEFICLIGIAKNNNLDKEDLTPEDTYTLIGVYYTAYEEDDNEPCHRYVYFMKGDLFQEDKLQVRGNQLIMSLTDDEKLYLDEDKVTKFPFSCLFSAQENFVVVLVEKNQQVFFVDSTEQFGKLGIFSTWPKHGYKLPFSLKNKQNNKYLKGMATMQNMLPFQKQPAPNDHISKIYCNDKFGGQFFRLYFSHKEADLTIQFPASIIVVSHEYMFRKYAASINTFCEEDKDAEILKFVEQTRKSRYIKPVTKKLKTNPNDESSQEIQQTQEQPTKQETKKQAQKEIKEIKKQSPKQIKQQVKQQKQQKKAQKQEARQPQIPKKIEQQQKSQSVPIKEQKSPDIQQPKQKESEIQQQKNGFNLFSKPIEIQPNQNLLANSNAFKGLSMFNTKAQDKPKQLVPSTKNGQKESAQKKPDPSPFAFSGSTNPIIGGSTYGGLASINFGSKPSTPFPSFGGKTGQVPNGGIFNPKPIQPIISSPFQGNKPTGVQTNGISTGANFGIKITSPFGKTPDLFSEGGAFSTKPKPAQPSLVNLNESFKNQFKETDSAKDKGFSPSPFGLNLQKNKSNPLFPKANPVKAIPSVFQKKQELTANQKPSTANSEEQNKKKLKQKLEYFVNMSKTVQNKIQTYESDEKAPQLFNLQNAKKLVQNWKQKFDAPYKDTFDEIANVLRKMQKFEKYKKSKLFKDKNQQEQKKQLLKNFKETDSLIDTLCYFVSFFQATDGKQKKSVFGPILNKPKNDAKTQEQKFIGTLMRRVRQLEKQGEHLNQKYKTKLAEIIQNGKKPQKNIKRYNFDATQFQSSESETDQTQEEQIIQKFKTEKQRNEMKKLNNYITFKDIQESLQKHEEIVQVNYKPHKPFIFITPLDEPVNEKDLNKKNIPVKTKTAQPEKISSKPFDSKLSNLGIKLEEKKPIPNLIATQQNKEKQIVKSESGGESEQEDIPNTAQRTISKVPILGGAQKKEQPKKNQTFSLFGNNPLPLAPKQQPVVKKQQKQKQRQTPFPKPGLSLFSTGESASFGTFLGNITKPQIKQPLKQPPQQLLKQPNQTKQTKPLFGILSSTSSKQQNKGTGFQGLFGNKATIPASTGQAGKKTQPLLGSFGGSTAPLGGNKLTFGSGAVNNMFSFTKKQEGKQEQKQTKKQAEPIPNKPTVQPKQENKPPQPTTTTTATATATSATIPQTKPTQQSQPKPTTETQAPKPTPIISNTKPIIPIVSPLSNQASTKQLPKQTDNKPIGGGGINFKDIGANQQNVFNKSGTQTATNNMFNNPNNPNTNNTNNNANNFQTQASQQPQPQQNSMQFAQNTTQIMPGHASTQFGSGNRFTNLGTSQQQPQQQQQTGWNPNQMKFGGDNANSGGLKTFASVGGTGQGNSWVSNNAGQGNSWINSNTQGNSWINANNNQNQQNQQNQQQGSANNQTNTNNPFSSSFGQQQQQQPSSFQSQPFQQQQQQQQQNSPAFQPWAANPTPNFSSGTFQMGSNPIQAPNNINQNMFQPRK